MNPKLRKFPAGLLLFVCSIQANSAEVISLAVEIGKNDQISSRTNIITVDDNKVRVDYLGAEKQKTDFTPYLLTLNNGKSWIVGHRDGNEFYCANVDMTIFFRDIGNIITRLDSFANADISNDKVELVSRGKGPEILGFPTTHVRIKTTAVLRASILFKKFQYEMNKVDDVWYVQGRDMHGVKKRWIEAMTSTGYQILDNLSRELRGNIPGMVIKQKSVMQLVNLKKNKVDSYTRNLQVVSIKQKSSSELDAGVFVRPECERIDQGQTKDMLKTLLAEAMLIL